MQFLAEQARDLVEKMLAYAIHEKIYEHKIDINKELPEIITEIIEKMDVNFTFTPHDKPVIIKTDRAKLKITMKELIKNACESVNNKTVNIKINLSVEYMDKEIIDTLLLPLNMNENRYAVIEVSDNGGGIPENILHKVFDPFVTTKFMGRGLGLSSVMGIVRAHNGGIDIKTSKMGTSVRIFILMEN